MISMRNNVCNVNITIPYMMRNMNVTSVEYVCNNVIKTPFDIAHLYYNRWCV